MFIPGLAEIHYLFSCVPIVCVRYPETATSPVCLSPDVQDGDVYLLAYAHKGWLWLCMHHVFQHRCLSNTWQVGRVHSHAELLLCKLLPSVLLLCKLLPSVLYVTDNFSSPSSVLKQKEQLHIHSYAQLANWTVTLLKYNSNPSASGDIFRAISCLSTGRNLEKSDEHLKLQNLGTGTCPASLG